MKNKIAAIVGLLAGCSLLLYWGGEAPPWLLKLECLAVMAGALFFGFSTRSASAPGLVPPRCGQGRGPGLSRRGGRVRSRQPAAERFSDRLRLQAGHEISGSLRPGVGRQAACRDGAPPEAGRDRHPPINSHGETPMKRTP